MRKNKRPHPTDGTAGEENAQCQCSKVKGERLAEDCPEFFACHGETGRLKHIMALFCVCVCVFDSLSQISQTKKKHVAVVVFFSQNATQMTNLRHSRG